jgi:hypothetical protein
MAGQRARGIGDQRFAEFGLMPRPVTIQSLAITLAVIACPIAAQAADGIVTADRAPVCRGADDLPHVDRLIASGDRSAARTLLNTLVSEGRCTYLAKGTAIFIDESSMRSATIRIPGEVQQFFMWPQDVGKR